jgi:hypothetical protein
MLSRALQAAPLGSRAFAAAAARVHKFKQFKIYRYNPETGGASKMETYRLGMRLAVVVG